MAVMTQAAGRLAVVALVATVLVSSCARRATTAAPPAPAGTTAYVSLSDSGHRPAASVAAKVAAAKVAAAKVAAAKVAAAKVAAAKIAAAKIAAAKITKAATPAPVPLTKQAPAPAPKPAPLPAPKPAPKPAPPSNQMLYAHMTNITCVMTGADTYTASFTLVRTGASSVRINNYKGSGNLYMGYMNIDGVYWEIDQDFSAACGQ